MLSEGGTLWTGWIMFAVGAFVILAYLTWELVRWDEAHPRNQARFPQRYAPGFEE